MQQQTEASSLKQKLADDLKQALRRGDKVRVSVLRLVISAVNNAEIARGGALPDIDVLGIIAREVKQRQESITAFKQGERADLVAKEEAEKAILQEYLPKQSSREEIIAEAKRIIGEVGAKGPGDKGKVMGKLMPLFKAKADGREVSAVVDELLRS